MTLFFQVVFPVLLIFASGYVLQKWRKLDLKSVSTVSIYILTTALVFRTFYQETLDRQYLFMVIFALILLVSLIALNKLYARLRRFSSATESGTILSTVFMNSGNYGAPIVLFAYGEAGFAYSISFMVLQAIIMNFFGVYYAARGRSGVSIALRTVLKMPATWAFVSAVLLKLLHLRLPEQLFAAVDLVASASVPLMMLILGMQIAEIKLKELEWETISYGVLVRLLVSPLLAYLILQPFPIDPLLEKVLILSAAMPTAVTTTVYSIQFDMKPNLVSSVTLFTTLFSFLTITVLLAILG